MNAERRFFVFSASSLALLGVLASACWAKDPCGEGLMLLPEGNCVALPVAPDAAPDSASASQGEGGSAADGESPADGGGEAAAPVEAAAPSNFGKSCAAMTDCGGDAPVCGAPQLPYCTQINCQPGQANAGACPSGFTCIAPPGYPSVCLKN